MGRGREGQRREAGLSGMAKHPLLQNVRLLPALTIEAAELDDAISRLERVLAAAIGSE